MNFRNAAFKSVMNGLYFSGLQWILGGRAAGLGAIFTLHHVRDAQEEVFSPNAHLSVTPQFIESTLQLLRKKNIDLVSLDEVARRIKNGHKGNRFAAFTFDDGYRDTAENAAPILRKFDVPYTIFVATGLIDGTADLWWAGLEAIIRKQDGLFVSIDGTRTELACATPAEKHAAYQNLLAWLTLETGEHQQRDWVRELADLYKYDLAGLRQSELMNWAEVRALAEDPLCTIGAHTIHHYAVARLSENEARREMFEGARVLAAALGEEPRHFAYPYGYSAAVGRRDIRIAKELGFETAVTTRPGVIYNEHRNHMTALPRISLSGKFQKPRYANTLISGLPTMLANKMQRINAI